MLSEDQALLFSLVESGTPGISFASPNAQLRAEVHNESDQSNGLMLCLAGFAVAEPEESALGRRSGGT
jgi:hypothetical protein